MPQLQTYFLGPFQVINEGKPITGFESDKMRALLAYLIVEGDQPHRREALAALLWPDQTDSAARQGLRQALYILRNALSKANKQQPPVGESEDGAVTGDSSEPLIITRQTVQLNPAADVVCDVRLLEGLLAACKSHKHLNIDPNRCSECIDRLQKASDLYRGDFLSGFQVTDSREFEEWMLLVREAQHRQVMYALGRLADYYEEVGEHERALQFALRQLKLESWREEAHRQAMRLLSRTGQRSGALAQYESCRQTLAEELGLEPSRETTALYERIRDAESEQSPGDLPVVTKSYLPMSATPIIGREAEVTAVVEQLLRDDIRLVTITGPGGVGKTRVALQSAIDLQTHFANGAYFVNLAPIVDPSLVPSAIAKTIGVKEVPGKSALESLVAYFQGKKVLLLLDNFEQIAGATSLVGQIVQSTSGVKVLITSRMALGLRGTQEYPLPPMSLPDRKRMPTLERLTGYEAIRLFVERARALKPSFEINKENAAAIVEICHRLDGLPLALELAAARIKVLSPQAMLAHLQNRLHLVAGKDRDVPTRQQTLRNTIDWSYNLLDDAERTLFQRMATFQGGRSLRAIQLVCSGNSNETLTAGIRPANTLDIDLLDSIESLVSKSLLRQSDGHDDEPRFWMLETIHEYAIEKLVESGEEADIRQRHARYFLQLAEDASPHLRGKDQHIWLEQVESEYDNIRAAFRWARQLGEAGDREAAELGLRLIIALERFWSVRVYIREGLDVATAALAIDTVGGPNRANVLRIAGEMAHLCGDFIRSFSLLGESLQIWRGMSNNMSLGDKEDMIDVLDALGIVSTSVEDFLGARAYYEEAIELEDIATPRKPSVHNLALVYYELGDFETADAMLLKTLAIDNESPDVRIRALTLANLALVAYEQGKYELALARAMESLGTRQKIGAKLGIVFSLEGLAMIYRGLGKYEKAAQLWGVGLTMRDTIGAPLPPNERARYKKEMDMVRAYLGNVAFERGYAEGCLMLSDDVVAELLEAYHPQTVIS